MNHLRNLKTPKLSIPLLKKRKIRAERAGLKFITFCPPGFYGLKERRLLTSETKKEGKNRRENEIRGQRTAKNNQFEWGRTRTVNGQLDDSGEIATVRMWVCARLCVGVCLLRELQSDWQNAERIYIHKTSQRKNVRTCSENRTQDFWRDSLQSMLLVLALKHASQKLSKMSRWK